MVTTILTIFTVVMLFFVLVSALFGLRKSWKQSLVKLGRTVCAIVLAFIAAKIITAAIPLDSILASIMDPFLGGDLSEIINTSPTLYALICNIPIALVAPALFISLYFVFNWLLFIPAHFVKKAVLKAERKARKEAKQAKKELKLAKKAAKKGEENGYDEAELKKTIKAGKISVGSRFGSAGIKAVNAVLFIGLMLMPFACLLTTVGEGVVTLKDAMIESGASFGGEEDIDTAIDGEALGDICDEYITPIVTNPVIAVSANPVYRAMFTSLTEVKVGDTVCYLDSELQDIFELLGGATYLLVDIEDYGDNQKNAIATVTGYIADSEFRSTVAAELFSAMAGAWQEGDTFLGIANPSTEEVAIIFDPLVDILAESTPESVENDLHTFSNILGILIDYEMFATIANTMESEDPMASVEELASSEFLADVLKEIYSNEDYKMMTQPVVKFTFNTLLTAIGAEPMNSASSDAPDLSEDEIKAEADAICAIILSAVDFVESMPEEGEEVDGLALVTEINMSALGKFYDSSQDSKILKDGFHDIFVAFLNSEMLDDLRGVCDIIIDHINNDPDLNMENLLVATQELATIFVQYQGAELSTDMTKLTSTLNSLINKVDTHTADIINEMLESDAFGMDFLGGDNNAQVSKLLTAFVGTMAEMENLTDEELEKEAKAIDYMMKIVNVGTGTSEGDSISSIFEAEEDNAEEMMDTMLNSKLSVSAINAVAYDENGELTEDALEMSESVTEEDKESVITSAENYYKENATGMTEEEKTTLKTNINAIATIFGTDLTSDFANWDAEIGG